MIDPSVVYKNIIEILDKNGVDYKLFNHRPVLSYEESAEVQKEVGYYGTEMKCLVMKADGRFVTYVTLQGNKTNFDSVKSFLEVKKIKLATAEELRENFGAEPGCAYPFGFDKRFDIFVDPKIYNQEWVLFSPVLPTKTVQARGEDLKKVFGSLENKVSEVGDFNQT
ncbi:MAG: YbaK/EbsC family protein [Patescibacteria group bacterium]